MLALSSRFILVFGVVTRILSPLQVVTYSYDSKRTLYALPSKSKSLFSKRDIGTTQHRAPQEGDRSSSGPCGGGGGAVKCCC